jgi:uncharacterized membrane protein
MKKELNILIIFAALWCTGIILPSFFGQLFSLDKSFENFLYRFYGAVCHQIDSRSFHLNGHSFAVCIRCTAIYFGFFLSLLGIRIFSGIHRRTFNPIIVLAISSVPMLLDVLCSFLPWYGITPMSRIFTGSIFGVGLALLLHRSLTEFISSLLFSKSHEIETR